MGEWLEAAVTWIEHVIEISHDRRIPSADILADGAAIVTQAALVTDHSASAREQRMRAAIEAQRDVELAMLRAARPCSALHSYHQGRSEAFSSVLAALSETGPAGPGRGAERLTAGRDPNHAFVPGQYEGCNYYLIGLRCGGPPEVHTAEPAPTGPERGEEIM